MKVSTNLKNAAGVKPSLLSRPELGISANNSVNSQAGENRILSNLKIEPPAKKPNHNATARRSVKFLSWLGISAAAAFSGYQYLSATTPSRASAGTPNQAVVLAAAPLTAATPVVAAPVAVSEAAQIIEKPSPTPAEFAAAPPAAGPAPREAKLTAALEKGDKAPAATLQKALEANASANGPGQAQTVDATPVTPKKKTVTAKARPAPAVDEDVTLLAALIAHSDASALPGTAVTRAVSTAQTRSASALKKDKNRKKKIATASSVDEKKKRAKSAGH